MLNKLPASSGDRFGWLKHPWVIGISILVHAVLLGGFMWLAAADDAQAAEEEINPEDITYIDVSEVPPPPEVEEPEPEPVVEQPEPAPRQEEVVRTPTPTPPAPRTPRVTPPAVTAPEQPAGFQELRPPRPALGVPPPTNQPPVRAEDFGGRGTPGGVAGGNPPPPSPPSTGASTGTGTGGGTGVDPNQTYTASAVDRVAELRNRGDLATAMRRLYPSHLRDAGVGGRVVAQFVVNSEGRVESGSIRIISAAHPDLGEQTRRAVADFRFRPAQKGSRNVRQLVQMAIDWQPAN
jgi:TonB family protein